MLKPWEATYHQALLFPFVLYEAGFGGQTPRNGELCTQPHSPLQRGEAELWKLRTDICKISIKKEKKALLSEREINFDILIISWRKGWCWNSEL